MLSIDQFSERAQKIKCMILDVDGVLTPGQIYLNNTNDEIKVFHVRDGFAIRAWERVGYNTCIITGRKSLALENRCRELNIEHLYQDATDKTIPYRQFMEQLQVAPQEIMYIGDDLPDLPLIFSSGLGVTVSDGVPQVKQFADWITQAAGGYGAVREMVELVLSFQGYWQKIVAPYHMPVDIKAA